MPTCREMSELVTDYLERNLPLRVRLGVRWHLSQCTACRGYVDQMRKLVGLLGQGAARAESADVADLVTSRLGASASKPEHPPGHLPTA